MTKKEIEKELDAILALFQEYNDESTDGGAAESIAYDIEMLVLNLRGRLTVDRETEERNSTTGSEV